MNKKMLLLNLTLLLAISTFCNAGSQLTVTAVSKSTVSQYTENTRFLPLPECMWVAQSEGVTLYVKNNGTTNVSGITYTLSPTVVSGQTLTSLTNAVDNCNGTTLIPGASCTIAFTKNQTTGDTGCLVNSVNATTPRPLSVAFNMRASG